MTSNYEALAQYFGGTKPPGPSSLDVAKFILLNAENAKPSGPGGIGPSKPSVMGRIFDILSRGNYASANYVREFIKTGKGSSDAFLEGLSGEKKTTYKDVLEDLNVSDPEVRATLGFILDIGLDPTTYIPVAGIASKLKGLKNAGKATNVEKALDKPLGQQLLDKGTPLHPESFGLPERAAESLPEALRGTEKPATSTANPSEMLTDLTSQAGKVKPESAPVGQLQFPLHDIIPVDVAKTVGKEVVEKSAKEVPGQIPMKFPDFNIKDIKLQAANARHLAEQLGERASTTVSRIAAGDILAASKLKPTPLPKASPKQLQLAEEIASKFDTTKSSAALNKKFPDTLNAKQQAKLWYQAKNAAAKNVFKKGRSKASITKAVNEAALKIYGAVESAMINAGKVPRIGTGENVKLSDVLLEFSSKGRDITDDIIREFSSNINTGSDVWRAVETLRARGAISDTKSVKLITEAIADSKNTVKASGVLSDAQAKTFDGFLKNFASNVARNSGMSPAAADASKSLVNTILNTGKSAAQIAVEQSSKMLDDVVATGIANTQANKVLTKGLERDLGKLPTWVVNDNKAAEFLMGRVATWWGQADLRPFSLNAIGSSAATASARGKFLDNLMIPYSQPQRHEAFRIAQGVLPVSGSPEVIKLSQDITRLMDNLTSQVAGSSVLLRSGVSMDLLNKWMRQYKVGFEFTNKKVKDLTGKEIDFSKGTDWVKSWKLAEFTDDPKAFLFRTQQAMEQATREKGLFDELGERFGSSIPGKGHTHKIEGYPYLEGYYFTKDIADQLPRVIRDWNINNWGSNSPLLKHYDRVLSMWKSAVTIYRPGHHIRNMAGDLYLGWMDGVNSLRPYTLAVQVQRSMRSVYKNLDDIDRLVQVGALPRTVGTPKPNQVLFTNKSGVKFTAEQIGAVAHQKGLLEHTRTIEDIIDMGGEAATSGINKLLNVEPFGGKVQAIARGASELQSHNARLAHFIDKVMKSRGSNIEEIFEQAARRSRKWHPTGLDLTQFEKKTMRRILPFYSWMRKSLPLLLEGLVMNPGKAVIPAKFFDALQEVQGINTPGRHDPFPVDQMFPEWIKAGGIGPISLPDGFLSGVSNQTPKGYVMAGMGLNPLAELVTQLGDPGRTILSSLTPGLKVPMELLSGRESFTGEPISGIEARPGALGEYIGEQIPFYSTIQGITGTTPFGTETKKAVRSDQTGREALVNWLTGTGIKGTGPYVRQARYEYTQPLQAQRKFNKEKFLADLRERMSNGNP